MKTIIFSLIILINWLQLYSQTIISGGEVSGEWTFEGSPYFIQGNISIPDGETLIIESGVLIKFFGQYEFNVMGRLLSNNTSEDTICFTANFGWKGLKFNISCNNNEISYLNNFEITKVKSLYSAKPLRIESSNVVLSNFSITDCVGLSNWWAGDIVAIEISSCSPIIMNCNIYDITGEDGEDPGSASGISVHQGSPQIINTVCSLTAAEAVDYGIRLNSSDATIINSVFYNSGYGMRCSYSTPTVINTIIWAYPFQTGQHTVHLSNSNPNFYYSNIIAGIEGFSTNQQVPFAGVYENCIDNDPCFIDPEGFDFHVTNNSPCIDLGTPSEWLIPPENEITINELLGYNCIGNSYDIGAYEYCSNALEENLMLSIKVKLTNYPNPFNPTTTISFSLQNNAKVNLSIYNIKGQKVKQLVKEQLSAGQRSINWNGDDESGKDISSGIYYYKLDVNGKTEAVKKCVLLK